jgi:hypothetical protein
MKTITDLPKPTLEFAQTKIREFNLANENLERGLTQLIEAFPKNSDLAHVLVKVAAINSLYNTHIFGVRQVAQLIQSREIDLLLESGSAEAVKAIERVDYGKRSRSIYSFATKYCSWHQRKRYPLYDTMVDFCLRTYRDQYEFWEFDYYSLREYEKFRRVVDEFRKRFQLESLSYKEIDMFLYQLGSDYFASAEPGSGQIGVQTASVEPTEIVLEVAGEGGSINLLRKNTEDGWQFRFKTAETATDDLPSQENRDGIESLKTSPTVRSFEEALEQLDRYPWTQLIPLKAHPEFLQQILAAVEKRYGKEIAAQWNERLTH